MSDERKEKFTPGPWEVSALFWGGAVPDGCDDWRTENKSVRNDIGLSICMVQGDTDKPMEANAHLIAAAPDMYAALKGLVFHGPTSDPKQLAAREALAKARGEA